MATKNPVVIYGASGYTGRLIAEYLREYEIPFIAAGRDKAKVEEAMTHVPGIETAQFEVAEVSHDVDALAELFAGAQVVCNTVGPFIKYGEVAVQAALKAGVHYLDTTGEQCFLIDMKKKYGKQFADAGLVLVPSMAYMYATQEIAAQIVLEEDGIDSLDTGLLASGVPTYGSTQSIFGMFITDNLYLENDQFVPWEKARGWEINVPGRMMTQLAHPWGGGSLPVWFKDDCRVKNCRQLTSFTNRPMFEQIIELQKHYEANIKQLPEAEQLAALSAIGEQMQPGMPPRENMLQHRAIDFAMGVGTAGSRTCVIRTGPGYLQTGVLQAAAAHKLINNGPDTSGFCSPAQALGYRYLLGALKNFFPVEVDVY
ncbi:trans-acting enoyl reductase family protein [Oceanicoccus sp. KOV_DT_Chl]|uniref:saccharopine dehydrogenase family protein n=1 Tax=Oceanicoccus sp. KOV_DT_Chl TaxID=1904639 RepID=UPI000C7A7AEA|nr:DUF5938 domain-containing protein [Oceanicoccus sp. KOV_DT_Chl]